MESHAGTDDVVARYVALCRQLGVGKRSSGRYPGSPVFARAVLGATAELALWESDPAALAALRVALGDDAGSADGGDGSPRSATRSRRPSAGRDVVVLVILRTPRRRLDRDFPMRSHAGRGVDAGVLDAWYP